MNIESRKQPNGGGPHLLIVDDDALIAATLAAALRASGYTVTECTSPTLALELCAAQSFDLAILDERMPGMSGTELATKLGESHRTAVAFLSAYDNQELIEATTRVGALGYFLKPVDPRRMLPALHNILGRAQELRALRQRETQLQSALNNEREINTAVGILMERLQATREEAFEALRRYARSQRQQVVKLAGDMLKPINDAHRLIGQIAAARVKTHKSDAHLD